MDVLIKQLAQRTGLDHEQAMLVLLGAYVAGDDSRLIAAFGEPAWEEIVKMSWTRDWE